MLTMQPPPPPALRYVCAARLIWKVPSVSISITAGRRHRNVALAQARPAHQKIASYALYARISRPTSSLRFRPHYTPRTHSSRPVEKFEMVTACCSQRRHKTTSLQGPELQQHGAIRPSWCCHTLQALTWVVLSSATASAASLQAHGRQCCSREPRETSSLGADWGPQCRFLEPMQTGTA